MTPVMHLYWHRCLFALKPIELAPDRTTLKVEFWWLPIKSANSQPKCMAFQSNPELLEVLESPGNNIKILDLVTFEVFVSGREITFHTSDPDKIPLPSFELLQMQWYLRRIEALRGVAEELGDLQRDDEVR